MVEVIIVKGHKLAVLTHHILPIAALMMTEFAVILNIAVLLEIPAIPIVLALKVVYGEY